MTESEAVKELHAIRPRGSIIPQKRAEALDVAIKALDQVAKLRELRNNLEEKERFYEKELYDRTLYSKGLADAYCTTNALIDEILGSE